MSISEGSEKGGAIRIRDASPSDYETVISLLKRAWHSYSLENPEIRVELEQSLLSYACPGDQERILAESDGIIVGTAELFHSPEQVYEGLSTIEATPILRRLAVLPECQGQGIATMLIRDSVRRALLAGSSNLYLHTSESNISAVNLYKRIGFVRADELDISRSAHSVQGYRLDLTALSQTNEY